MSAPVSAPSPGDAVSDPAEDMGGRSRAAWFFTGLRQGAAGPMFIVALSLFGIGSLARDAGFSAGVAGASTLFIWAGPAQVIFFGSLATNTPLPAVALSVSLSSIRFLPMCVALLPLLKTRRTGIATMLAISHFTAVTVWAESMRRLPALPQGGRIPFYFGFAFACVTCTTASTMLGHVVAGELPEPLAAGLLFLTPIYFISTLLRSVRRPIDWLALVFGLGLAPFAAVWLGSGPDLFAIGIVGGSCAYFTQRYLDARRLRRRT